MLLPSSRLLYLLLNSDKYKVWHFKFFWEIDQQ